MGTALTHRFIDANGIRIHVAEQGEGPTVVLLHGFPESWYSWRHQLAGLSAAGYHVVALDMRGYGQTDAPADAAEYTMLHLVGDVIGVITALGTAPVVVVGHDWGAPAAWHTALFRPDLVRGVAGLSVPYVPRGDADMLTAMAALITERNYQAYFQTDDAEDALNADIETFVRRFVYTLSGDNPVGHDLSIPAGVELLDSLADTDQLPPWLTADDLAFYVGEFARVGIRGGLNWYRTSKHNHALLAPWTGAPITTHALYVGGDRDTVVNWPGMRDYIGIMQMAVPNLTKAVILDGCGHWTQQERPDEVNALLLEFLGTLS